MNQVKAKQQLLGIVGNFILALMLSACQANTTLEIDGKQNDTLVCSMQYDPVCATLQVDDSTVKKTFSNGCTVNQAEAVVISIDKGECEAK